MTLPRENYHYPGKVWNTKQTFIFNDFMDKENFKPSVLEITWAYKWFNMTWEGSSNNIGSGW